MLEQVPTEYQGGWFDFARAVPCWIEFQSEKSSKIVLTRRQRDFKATVKPGIRYAARLLLINPEKTVASIDFPELGGFADGLDLSFARPIFPSLELTTASDLAEVAGLLRHFCTDLDRPVRLSLLGDKLHIE